MKTDAATAIKVRQRGSGMAVIRMLAGNNSESNDSPPSPAPQSENRDGSASVKIVVSPIGVDDGK